MLPSSRLPSLAPAAATATARGRGGVCGERCCKPKNPAMPFLRARLLCEGVGLRGRSASASPTPPSDDGLGRFTGVLTGLVGGAREAGATVSLVGR